MKTYYTTIILFQIGLLISGITAFFIPEGMPVVLWMTEHSFPDLLPWLQSVASSVDHVSVDATHLLYGYDWLGFAHVLFAILFIGALKDPERNRFLLDFGLIACALIIPTAFIAGHFRGIPPLWRLMDSMFGVIGGALLLYARYKLNKEHSIQTAQSDSTKYLFL